MPVGRGGSDDSYLDIATLYRFDDAVVAYHVLHLRLQSYKKRRKDRYILTTNFMNYTNFAEHG